MQAHYHNDHKFSDRQVWANSVDPDQTAPEVVGQRVWPKIRHLATLDGCACTFEEWVCVCIIWTRYSIVNPPCSNFRVNTGNFSGILRYLCCAEEVWLLLRAVDQNSHFLKLGPWAQSYMPLLCCRCSCQPHLTNEPRHEKTCFAICEKQRCRSASASTQSDQHLCCSLLRLYNISSSYIRNFQPLPSCWSWAGWFESYLVENPKDRFSHDEAQTYVSLVQNSIPPVFWMRLWRLLSMT